MVFKSHVTYKLFFSLDMWPFPTLPGTIYKTKKRKKLWEQCIHDCLLVLCYVLCTWFEHRSLAKPRSYFHGKTARSMKLCTQNCACWKYICGIKQHMRCIGGEDYHKFHNEVYYANYQSISHCLSQRKFSRWRWQGDDHVTASFHFPFRHRKPSTQLATSHIIPKQCIATAFSYRNIFGTYSDNFADSCCYGNPNRFSTNTAYWFLSKYTRMDLQPLGMGSRPNRLRRFPS